MITILSMDPGQANFAYCVSQHRYDPILQQHQARILASGHFKSVLMGLKNYDYIDEQIRGFKQELNDLLRKHGPFDSIIAERFMGRGVRIGTMNETVNILIGVLLEWAASRGMGTPHLVSAAIWKNEYNRQVAEYSDGLNADYKMCAASPHQFDAALIGHYRAARIMETRPFTAFADEMLRDRYMQWVERASSEPLVRRRLRRQFYALERVNVSKPTGGN